jgi:hypothetical protein
MTKKRAKDREAARSKVNLVRKKPSKRCLQRGVQPYGPNRLWAKVAGRYCT